MKIPSLVSEEFMVLLNSMNKIGISLVFFKYPLSHVNVWAVRKSPDTEANKPWGDFKVILSMISGYLSYRELGNVRNIKSRLFLPEPSITY